MLAPTLKDYLRVLEATHKSAELFEGLYSSLAEALEKLDVATKGQASSRLRSMKRMVTQSASCFQAWRSVVESIDLEVRAAESIRLFFEKVLGPCCLASVLRRMDYSCWLHDQQNHRAFLQRQQRILKEGIGWVAQYQSFDPLQRQLFTLIQSFIDDIDKLLEANTRLEAMVQASIQGILEQNASYEQSFQNLLQHCQRGSSPSPQEGCLELHAAFMDRVLGRLQPLSPVQGGADTGESHV